MLSRIWSRSRNHSSRVRKNGSRPFRRALHECLEERTLLATYVVANVSDGGLGSLRQAIIDANSHAGPDQINFAIPGAGSHTIQPSTALPTITDPVNIDGTTQPGSIRNSLPNGDDAVLKIELDGSLAGSAHGLWITAGNSSVRGLVINRFAGDGIRLETRGGNVVEGNFIGVDPTGLIAMGNGTSGIGQSAYFANEFVPAFGIEIIGGSSDNVIGTNGDNSGDVGERNVISSNIKADVFISGLGTNRNVVAGNFIGTNAAGTGSFGPVAQGGYNYNVGVFINGGSQSNRVGTDGNGTADAAERNIISGHFGNTGRADDHHSSRGVEIANLSSTTTTLGLNVVAGNYIGTDVTGTRKLGNSIGVGMQLGDLNRVGTNADGVADAAERNLISGNSVGIHLFGSNQNVISGNYVGTDVTGTTNTGTVAGDLGNSTGIWVLSSASNIVGGTAAGAGNLVSGNTYYGIQIQGNNNPANSGADNNTVQGNLIGTDATGTVAISNGGYGLYLNSNSNLIGGTTTAARNVISASGNVVGGDGIHIVGYSNVIQGNYIGTDISGAQALGNSGSPSYLQGNGIRVLGGTGNRIGGSGTGEGNLIAFNVGAGVMVSGYDPTGNAIRGNSIHSNNGLGIDLAPWAAFAAGVSSNDLGDLDLGPNGYQNFPLLVSAHSSTTGTTIAGTLNSTPLTVFALDFYSSPTADPSAHGEGKSYLGSGTATTDINGNVTFNLTVSGVAAGGQFVSATATHPDGSTSEFSANEIACFESPSLIVTTQSDVVANDCETSLREAINYANSHANSLNPGGAADWIRFNIPGSGPHSIQVLSALPTVTDPVVIDGYTQPGSSLNTLANGDNAVLMIELSGALAGPAVSGLVLTGGNNTVRGLAIHSFEGHGIQVGDANLPATPAGSVIEGNFIGTNASGSVKLGNASVGIHVINSSNNLVGTNADGVGDPGERNIILGNNFGVFIQTAGPMLSHNNVVAGNFLGTDRTGTITDPNGVPGDGDELGNSYGIKIANSNFNTVGGTTPAARNVISGNTYLGVHIQGTGHQGATLTEHNVVQGNLIGTDVTGTLDRGNGVAGVDVESAEFTQVGGVTAASRNIISGNDSEAGLWLNNAFSTVAQGNYIGTDITGTLPLGNTGSTYFLGGNGVKVQIGANNIVGGNAVGEGNLIANNNGAGVLVTNNNFIPTSNGNAIRGNSIFANGGLGIDIAPNGTNTTGVTGNDVGDADVGPNGYQNFPMIASAQSSGGGTTITGTLNSTPMTTFTLDFYTNVAADPSGYGEGQTYLGSANVTTDINGDVSFNVTVSGVAPIGWFVSATATNAGSTSEFSGLTKAIAGNVGATISGTKFRDMNKDGIRQGTENVLNGWTIYLDMNNDGDRDVGESFTVTSGFGQFSFTNLPAGTYHVREEQHSGWTQTTPLLDVTVGSGQTFTSGDIGNYREATISGIKFVDFNGNGLHTIGEIGLDNWTIYLDTNNNGSLDSDETRTQTDANGGYLFDPVPAGTYNVREVQQSGWMQTTANPFVITVASNVSDQTYTADFGNFQLGSIQGGGVKFHDVNRNGVKDIDEVGLSGWTIYLDNNNNNSLDSGEPANVTDGAGGYSFGNLPAGVYHIREVQQSGWVQTTAPLDRTISTSGQTVAAGAIGNYRLATISGTKYEDGNRNGQRDPGEQGLGNWTIYLDANGNNAFDPGEINTQTTLGGLYSFGGLDVGNYVVREVQQVGWTQTSVNPGPINVLPNVSAQTFSADFGNFHGLLSGSISGRVYVDADNDAVFDTVEASLFGVTVSLIGVDDQGPVNRSTSTDVLGVYHFENLRPGSYRINETQPSGYLDGKESLGNLGGTLANDAFFMELSADANARDYNFGELNEAKLSGYVFDDFDDDGQLDFGEGAVSNVVITLGGVDDRGQTIHQTVSTDTQGYFEFDELRPGTYSLTEQQRSGYLDGKDTLGSQGGTLGNDQFASISLKSGDHGMNYNFGDHADTGLHRGQTATIGYWQNKNGQALISSLNGGPSSTSLGNWLASQFPNMYGVDAADRNLTGNTNAQVAAFYVTLFKAKGPKIDAQVMATALAVYVTNTNLAGSIATAYGFQVSSAGTGAATFSVGTSGAAFGVANGSRMTILQILSATNARAVRGKLYNGATSLQNLAIVVFDGINQGGDIL